MIILKQGLQLLAQTRRYLLEVVCVETAVPYQTIWNSSVRKRLTIYFFSRY